MELFQWGTNPWGQDVLVRISWSLLYLAFYGGLAFLVGHAVWKQWFARAEAFAPSAGPAAVNEGHPPRRGVRLCRAIGYRRRYSPAPSTAWPLDRSTAKVGKIRAR